MKESNLRCENCTHAIDPQFHETEDSSWIDVICTAPVPAWAEPIHDDTTTGHMAAIRCSCYEALPQQTPNGE